MRGCVHKILPGTGRGTAEGGGGVPRLRSTQPIRGTPPSALRAATSPCRGGLLRHSTVIARGAGPRQSSVVRVALDCFTALAMTRALAIDAVSGECCR